MARVRIAATTSRESPRTRLFGGIGLYSQIAVVVSIATVLVMTDMTLSIPRLRMCARQGS